MKAKETIVVARRANLECAGRAKRPRRFGGKALLQRGRHVHFLPGQTKGCRAALATAVQNKKTRLILFESNQILHHAAKIAADSQVADDDEFIVHFEASGCGL